MSVDRNRVIFNIILWNARTTIKTKINCHKKVYKENEKNSIYGMYLQRLQLMQTQKHFIRNLTYFIFGQNQFLYTIGTLKSIRFNAGYMIASQIEFNQMWQTSKETIGFDAPQFIVVQKTARE